MEPQSLPWEPMYFLTQSGQLCAKPMKYAERERGGGGEREKEREQELQIHFDMLSNQFVNQS